MDGFIVWMKKTMECHELTQEMLAECLGVSPGHVSKLLAGERRPGRKVMEGAAGAFPDEWLHYLRGWAQQPREGEPEP